jgi:hypothetical protein
MGYYKILGLPMSKSVDGYKGLYREWPSVSSTTLESSIGTLLEEYLECIADKQGITEELNIEELYALETWFSRYVNPAFELIYFDTEQTCPYKAQYYGADIAGFGGYSLLGEGLFNCSNASPLKHLFSVLNEYFQARLNENIL